MALETLKGVKKIGGFEIKEVDWNHAPDNFIEINHVHNAITFKIQEGPVKYVGINGCQIDTVIETVKLILESLNEKIPCVENALTISCLDMALETLHLRKINREARGVEGSNAL